MKNRTSLITILIVIYMLVSLNISFSGSNYINENIGVDFSFENVDVIVLGRCRSIGSTDSWTGGLFIGTQYYSEAIVYDTPLERICILIHNETISEQFFRLIDTGVYMFNTTGIFYWGAKGFGVNKIPPMIIIKCHAESIHIRGNDVQP